MLLPVLLLVAADGSPDSSSRQEPANLTWFDSRRFCESIAAKGGGQASVINGCLEHEDLARERMKVDVPESIRTLCVNKEKATSNGGSYMSFNGCVQREMQSAEWSRASHEH